VIFRGLFRDQPHLAVVEQQRMAGPQRSQDLRMRKLDAGGVARRLVGVERKSLAVLELDRAFGEGAESELRSLQVDQDADRAAVAGLDIADRRHQLPHLVMRGVAHVDAEQIGAGFEQAADHREV
jgi:hypothetical protein